MSFGCPYCGAWVDVSEDLDDYEWSAQTGKATTSCPECEKELQIEAKGYVDWVTCLTENDLPTDEELEVMHGDDMLDLMRDREAGCL